MNSSPRRSWCAISCKLLTLCAFTLGCGMFSPVALADQAEVTGRTNIFSAAIDTAQERCVKIYGAGIGREPGYASGIIISPSGHILTASGIFLAGNRIRVVLPDGSLHLAQVERRSDPLQAAILKIDASTPNYFEVPAQPPAQAGDWIVGVSNLFKVAEGAEELSANLGIVSLRTRLEARRGTQDVPYDGDVLLIDAITSNPGAPGGALVNIEGQLVGMIGKTIESASTNTRLNYGVPSDLLRKFIDGEPLANTRPAVQAGKVDVGIKLLTLSGRRAPAYVDRVTRDSPADRAGVRRDDLVLSIGQETVRNVADYLKAESQLKPGEEIPLVVKRKNQVLALSLTPGGESESPLEDSPQEDPAHSVRLIDGEDDIERD